jgi:hypothetical protein
LKLTRKDNLQLEIEPARQKVQLTQCIEKALPSVRKAFKSYNSPTAKRAYRYQYVWPSGETLLRMAVMPEMVKRALLIFDSIIRECKNNKWEVQLPAKDNKKMNAVIVDGITIHFTISEQKRQEKIKSEDSWHEWDFRYHSLGILRFQYGAGYSNREIKDGKKLQLEDRLDDIIQAFRDEVIAVNQAKKARQEREYKERLRHQVERLLNDAQSKNEQRDIYLSEQLSNFEKYLQLNKFIKHMKTSIGQEGLTPEIEQWFEWLHQKSEKLNPASNIDELYFSIPIDLLTQVATMISNDEDKYREVRQVDLPKNLECLVRWNHKFD